MDKLAKLDLMDKIGRELEDLANSQESVLRKIAQIEADNINLGSGVLDKKLPDVYAGVDKNHGTVTALADEFKEARNKFYNDNNLGALEDPTA